jgi:class 3 adenylate cyclase
VTAVTAIYNRVVTRCSSCNASNPPDMRFCGRCGRPLEKPLARERRNVSIVFVDLCGFTSLTHGFDPETLRDLADQVLTVVAGIIEDYDGYIDAFQGDGLIALFGAPHSHHDDPQRAVQAASAGLKAIEKIGESKGYSLKGRAGVNTGTVIAGAVGSGRVREYTVMGSAVNFAARLEEAASPGEVWVGPETYEATRHRMTYEAVSGVELQGFPNITEVYRLRSLNETSEIDPYGHLQFVGREVEIGLLQQGFDQALHHHQTQNYWLVGEAGSGKTRLVKEFGNRVECKQIWIQESHDICTMWRQLAGQMFDLTEEDDRHWQKVISGKLQAILPNEPRWQVYILRSLSLMEERPWRRLERRNIDRTFLAWRDFFAAWLLKQNEPLILSIEHGSQISVFSQFLDLLQETPLQMLLLRTSRRQDIPVNARIIPLLPLSIQGSFALVEQLASPVMAVATRSLVLQVGGIPANLLELGRALDITPKSSFSASINSLLQARLDMLKPSARQLLAYAALTGERSWESMLVSLSGINDPDILASLVQENILLRDLSSSIATEVEYRFQSELLRKAVLRMIPQDTDKTVLHLQIATWLEKNLPLNLSTLIAEHFKEGQSFEAAYHHYLTAADLALQEGNVEESYKHYDAVLSLEVPTHLLTQAALGYAHCAIGAKDIIKAQSKLTMAEAWLELCQEDLRPSLQASHDQFLLELKALFAETQASEPNTDQATLVTLH